MTLHVQFFFAFQKERRGKENNIGKFMFVSLSLSLSPSVMWFCLPLSPSRTHAFYVFFIDVKQAWLLCVYVCFFFLSPLCHIAVATPRFFFLLFFSRRKKKGGMRITVIEVYGMKKKAASTLFRNLFFFFNGADVFNHLFFSFFALFFFNLPVWISVVHFTDLQPSSLTLLFSSA